MRRRIVVLGATGRTGRLLAQDLTGAGPVLLVGRDARRLRRLTAETGLPSAIATLDDVGGLLVPGDVLVNLVGPYDVLGDRVVGAAIAAGVTYLDVAGEPAFLRRLHEVHDAPARAAGTTVLPAVGYEYLPGVLLAEQVVAAAVGAARAVEVAYLAEGGLDAGSASGRRSLLRAMGRPTTTFAGGRHVTEAVATRRSTFEAGGRRHPTVSLGGAEVWALPARHRALRDVDVHTGWFGPLGLAVSLTARVSSPVRQLLPAGLRPVDAVLDRAVAALGDGRASGLGTGTSRFVARARDGRGVLVARREAVAGNPIVLAARLAAATAMAVAESAVADLPPGVTDPVGALGLTTTARLAEWAGLVTT